MHFAVLNCMPKVQLQKYQIDLKIKSNLPMYLEQKENLWIQIYRYAVIQNRENTWTDSAGA